MNVTYTPRGALTWEEVQRKLKRAIEKSAERGESPAYLLGLKTAQDIYQVATAKTKSPYRRKEIFLGELRLLQKGHEETIAAQPDMSDERFEECLVGISHAIVYGEAHRPQLDPYSLRDRRSSKLIILAALGAAGVTAVLSRKFF